MFGIEELPPVIPVFPLTGALLLPKGHLPLHIFEPRYLEMINFARENNGLIGMVQPHQHTNETITTGAPDLYRTGCVGMISDFDETPDGRYMIMLTGLSRYDIQSEMDNIYDFRMVQVSYDRFGQDCGDDLAGFQDCRERLMVTLKDYLAQQGATMDLKGFDNAGDEELVNVLAMICPFSASEKQALLEALTLTERLELMIKLMQFSLSGDTNDPQGVIH